MNGYVDLHLHLLPFVDDGARDEKDAQEIFLAAYRAGTRVFCLTPHYKEHHFRDENAKRAYADTVSSRFRALVAYAKENAPDATLCLGNEIFYHEDLFESLASGYAKALNRTRYLLIEFDPGTDYRTIRAGLSRVTAGGMKPVLAHVERYEALLSSPDRVEELAQAGVTIQANASSLVSFSLFRRQDRFLDRLMRSGLIHVVASDAHDVSLRSPDLSTACAHIEKRYGADTAMRLLRVNPISILENKNL